MADTKISAYAAVASIDGTEEYAVNESGTTKKATGAQQATYQEARIQQGVLCSDASDQTLTTATWTSLAFDTESWKVGDSDIHSTSVNNSRLTAQITGEYLVTGLVQWEAVAADFILQTRIYKNGGSVLWRFVGPSLNAGSFNGTSNVTGLVRLTATDYVELQAYHNQGSDYDAMSTGTRFGMYLVGR